MKRAVDLRLWFRRAERVFSLLANIAVVVGLILVVYQINLANRSERKRLTVDSINETREKEFLESFKKRKGAQLSGSNSNRAALNDDLNYVANTYDRIALLYLAGLLDKCLVKRSIADALNELDPILVFMDYPDEYREQISFMFEQLKQLRCPSSEH